MSESRPEPVEAHLAEQHLGDRLSALVDGELGHESRERVLAHLATCARCRAEAEAQRRLKNVFAEAAPPPPSETFLARLQGLPGGGGPDGGMPSAGGAFPGRDTGSGVFGQRRDERFEFGYVPAAHAAPGGRGFPLHPVGRPDAERAASRGLRLAFAAAGAVSLAAVALGGVASSIPGGLSVDARAGSGTGDSVVPTRSAEGTAAAAGTQPRRALGPLLVQEGGPFGRAPASVTAPLLPGMPSPAGASGDRTRALTTPVMAGAAAVSPLIRPLDETDLTAWTPMPEVPDVGLLSVPVPGTATAPSASASRQVP